MNLFQKDVNKNIMISRYNVQFQKSLDSNRGQYLI